MDAANVVFQSAKRRCYLNTAPNANKSAREVADLADDEDEWAALDEAEGITVAGSSKDPPKKKSWLPKGMDPVLEELPKWALLADVLQEIEEEMIRLESKTSVCKPPTLVLMVCN